MLESITKNWEDSSDLKRFKFTFCCDRCGKDIVSPEYKFISGFKPKLLLSESERKARELIWQRDHDAAYERANNEAAMQLNRCPKCGNRVCDACYELSRDLCTDCACRADFVTKEKE